MPEILQSIGEFVPTESLMRGLGYNVMAGAHRGQRRRANDPQAPLPGSTQRWASNRLA
jgi:hypothetical protein